MKNEEKLLVNICKAYIGNEELPVPEDIDWNRFYSVAKNHNLVGVCHCVFNKNKKKVPDKVRAFFLDRFFDLIYVYEKQVNAYEEIKSLLNSEKIPFIPFKGILIKDIYPVPESRSMGDIDILIKPDDSKKLKTAFENSGFIYDSTCGYVDVYKKGNAVIEVHTKLSDDFENKFDDAFEHGIFNGFEGRFDDDYHLVYLIAHTAKHIKNNGAGIRFILDAAFMLKEKSINTKKVFEMLENFNLAVFVRVVFSICKKWFGYGECFIADTERIQEYFLKSGVFGAAVDSKTAAVSRLKSLNALNDGNKNSALKLRLRLAFPPYKALVNMPYIKFIKNRPWLTPAAWIYRFFYNLKNRKSSMLQRVKAVGDKETVKIAEDELKFLEEVGLI